MTNINEMLNMVEAEIQEESTLIYGMQFDLKICNKASGAKDTMSVYSKNELGQVCVACEDLIGINPNSSTFVFENARTQKSTSDKSMTLEDFDIKKGDTLIISDDGKVAADK